MEQLQVDFSYTLVPGAVKSAMSAAGAKSRDLWQVPREHIRLIPGFNVREKNDAYHAHIRSLADSMKSEGFKQHKPLAGYVAKENGVDVILIYDGHCRLEGRDLAVSEGAEIPTLPVAVGQAGVNLEDLTVELIRSNEGKELTPLEKAVVCKRLAGYGWEIKDIARRLGFTVQYVNDLLLLIASPAPIREMVAKGEVSASVAVDTVKKAGDKAVSWLVKAKEQAAAGGKTKVTRKHVGTPDKHYAKAIKDNGARMAGVLLKLVDESGYECLSEELREQIGEIVTAIRTAKETDTKENEL